MRRLVRSRLQFRSAAFTAPLSTVLAFCILVVAGHAAAQGDGSSHSPLDSE